MANELQNAVRQGGALWTRLSATKRIVVAATVLGSVVFLYSLLSGTSVAEYSVLHRDVRPDQAGSILAALKKENIPYQLADQGTTILVPKDKIHETRINMAQRGATAGFELFDQQGFGTTSFVEQVNYRRALQGELVRTIVALDVVERARVHLALAKRSLFRNDDEAPSASVVVHTRSGTVLSSRQVSGIVHLLSSSVEGLSPDRVSVVDQRGNVLSSGDDAGLELQRELEVTLARRIRTIVERFVGAGHVVVEVTAELDRQQTDETRESYDKDNTVLRSEARTEERSGQSVGVSQGVAGARGNLPGASAATSKNGTGGGLQRLTETKNYEVNRVVSRIKGPKVKIKRLHVALLVDGLVDANTTKSKRGAPENRVPRSKEQLARIEALAREAAGLDPARGDRIEVHSVPFVDPPVIEKSEPLETTATWLSPRLLIVGGIGLAIILLLALMLRSLGRQQKDDAPQLLPSLPATVGQIEAALPQEGMPNLALPGPAVPGNSSTAPAVAGRDTERAARMLSSWLSESSRRGSAA